MVEGLRAGESREGHTSRILVIMRLVFLIYHCSQNFCNYFLETHNLYLSICIQCRQLEKLQTGVDTVITDVKVVFPFGLFFLLSFEFLGRAKGHKHAEWEARAILL